MTRAFVLQKSASEPFITDKRLMRKMNALSEAMYKSQCAVVMRISSNWAEFISFCRFLNNKKVSVEGLLERICSGLEVAGRGHVLVLQDTTELNFAAHAAKVKKGVGPVGNNRDCGFFLHSSLVVDAESGEILGLSEAQILTRSWEREKRTPLDCLKLPISEKESFRWPEAANYARLSAAGMVTFVGDRENDIFEFFATCPAYFVVRSRHDRRLERDGDFTGGRVSELLARLAPAAEYRVEIKAEPRQKRAARTAECEIRYAPASIPPPSGKAGQAVKLYVIELKEKGGDGLLWRIYTNHEIKDVDCAVKAIEWYSRRWTIEEMHRSLKSDGMDVESSQMQDGEALKRLTVLALNAALRTLTLVQGRNSEAHCGAVFDAGEITFLNKLLPALEGKTEKQKNPHPRGTMAWAAWIIGRLGGWKGYAKSKPPGIKTMRRGLEKFDAAYFGATLFKEK